MRSIATPTVLPEDRWDLCHDNSLDLNQRCPFARPPRSALLERVHGKHPVGCGGGPVPFAVRLVGIEASSLDRRFRTLMLLGSVLNTTANRAGSFADARALRLVAGLTETAPAIAPVITNMEPGRRGARIYFEVDEASERRPVPGMGWISICRDPQGNTFGLWQNDPSARP
jgi:hypothetical protein